MFSQRKIAFIGPGAMAEAMIAGLIRQEVASPASLIAAGPRQARLDLLSSIYGISGCTDNRQAVGLADVVVLAVKPQRLDLVLRELRGVINPQAVVLSIVAGAAMPRIQKSLGNKFLVRAMPNTPAQIGEGITVWTAAPEVDHEQREMARRILGALGQEIFMEDEYYLDMATALSGTGPAYVFMFMEAMVDAGVHLGFPRRIAEQLVSQTVRGSVDFYRRNYQEDGTTIHLAQLRNQVTSPGGTTAAALYQLEKAGFRTAISRAVWAAYERSVELGKDKKVTDPEKNE